jgi:threonine/homoserine/homoserine lactone efflux protein
MSGGLGMFLRGLLLGFSIAAPVGPIGVLCIRRTLADGRLAGFCSGLGAATADATYGAVAALGLTAVSRALTQQQDGLRLLGGLFLLYLGARTALAAPAAQAAAVAGRGRGLAGMYVSTLALTLTNPTTILSFAAVFAGMGFAAEAGGNVSLTGALLVLGVFLGSGVWWFILSGGVSLARRRVTPRVLAWVNRVSGGILCAFGALALASLAR